MKSKKIMNGIVSVIAIIILGIVFFQTNGKNEEETVNNVEVVEARGNYTVIECMNHIETSNTVEELNNIIGFEAEKSEYSEEYTWKLDDKNSIVLKYAGDSPILQATIDKEKIISEEVKLPSASELKQLLNEGSFTYEELVLKLNGIQGVLAGKTNEIGRAHV